MKYQNHVTIEDLKLMLVASSKFKSHKLYNNLILDSPKNFIYREFEKKDEKFIATNDFFISEEIDGGNIEYIKYNNINIKMVPYLKNNNIYEYLNDKNSRNYCKLIVLSNIEFQIDEINLNKNEIIKKFIDNDTLINEDFFEDLYYNKSFSKKINIKLPDKYKFKNKNINVIIDKENISIKYLFRIEFNKLSNEYNNEMI